MSTRRKMLMLNVFLLSIIWIIIILINKSIALAREGRIVFSLDDNGNTEIFSMDIDGKNLKNLTNHPAIDELPASSPSGRYIAFISWRNGSHDLFIMDADGKNPRLLINGVHDKPSWSPDSKWVAFEKDFKLFVMNINSGILKEIPIPLIGILRTYTSWSSDGQKIAFRLINVGDKKDGDIYTINIDGTNLQQLTKDPANDQFPAWSPDGKQIAFYSGRDGGGIFIMDSDGANVKLIRKIRFACCPSWSKDGQKIVFSPDNGIFVMNSDGSNVKQIFNKGGAANWLEGGGEIFNIESEYKLKTIWGKIKLNF